MEYLWVEGWIGERKTVRQGRMSKDYARNDVRGHAHVFPGGSLGAVQGAQVDQRPSREHPVLQWDPAGLGQGLPCPVPAGV